MAHGRDSITSTCKEAEHLLPDKDQRKVTTTWGGEDVTRTHGHGMQQSLVQSCKSQPEQTKFSFF